VEDSTLQPVRLKLDPGSKTTGMALVRESEEVYPDTGEVQRTAHVLKLADLQHRGHVIREALTQRASFRRRRRGANLRHRAPRFCNRTRPAGWLAPSLQHRADTTLAWVRRLQRWSPITALSQELVRFDMQLIQNPEISGVEYQHGTLQGYEVREYLLEKWHRTCAYCPATNVPLQVEHIVPRAKGGSHRVSNLTLACGPCNTAKGTQDVRAFLAQDPKRLARVLAQAKAPLRDAAAMKLFTQAEFDNLPVIDGVKQCPTGDYSSVRNFGERCVFGAESIFCRDSRFADSCIFGEKSRFGVGCSFCDRCVFGIGIRFEIWCKFGLGCIFGSETRFGDWCGFGAECVFGDRCAFGVQNRFGERCIFAGRRALPENPLLVFPGAGTDDRIVYAINVEGGPWIEGWSFSGGIDEFRAKVRVNGGGLKSRYLSVAYEVAAKWCPEKVES